MSWELTGNAGINPTTNFLGTTDSEPLVLKTNSTEALRINSQGAIGIGVDPLAHLHIVSHVPRQLGPSPAPPQVIIARTTPLGGGSVSSVIDFVISNGSTGIGTSTPAEKLSVAGIIRSTSGGIKFPDGTVQTTAGISQQQFSTSINASINIVNLQINNLQQQINNLLQQVNNLTSMLGTVSATATSASTAAASASTAAASAQFAADMAQSAADQAQATANQALMAAQEPH